MVAVAAAGVFLSGCGDASRPARGLRVGGIAEIPSGTRACRASQLKIRTIHSSAGLGKAGAYIAFTNVSRAACELTGWPKLVAITAAGKASTARDVPPSAFPATTAKIPAPIVKLSSGNRADAAFLAADGAASRCPPSYTSLRVTPPGLTKSIILSAWVRYLGAYLPDCSTIVVSPVVPAAYLQGG